MRTTAPKSLRTFLVASVASLTWLLPAAARATDPDQVATFEKLKSLAGTWTGRMEDALEGPPVTVRYEVASNGKALIEHQNPGKSFEMVTIYYLANGRLQATHYCAAGNQPAWRLDEKSTDELALFEFAGGTGFDADLDGHVHKGEIRFLSPYRIEHRWFHYVGPKQQGSTHWFLERQARMPAEPPATVVPPAS